jgi:hypothetical protein
MRLVTALAAAALMVGIQAANAASYLGAVQSVQFDQRAFTPDEGSVDDLLINAAQSDTPQTPVRTPLQKCMHECGRVAIGKSKNCKDPDDEAQVECLGKERVEMHHCYAQCKKAHKTSS